MTASNPLSPTPTKIKLVGVCAAGKSTLLLHLRAEGYLVLPCAQEHSYVPDLWRRLNPPDVLVYLDAQPATVAQRRHTQEPVEAWLAEERKRLAHARAHCDLYLATDALTPVEVAAAVMSFLNRIGARRAKMADEG